MKFPLFFLFQLFASFLLSIYRRFFFLTSFRHKRPNSISSDIWLDIGDFLNLKQRHQLLLVNREFMLTIDRGMQKFWCTEEDWFSMGNLMIDKHRLLTYRANLDELLGRQNLFLHVRLRLVENVGAGKLGRGDALIVATEYKPIKGDENKETILAAYGEIAPRHSSDFFTILWKNFKKRIAACRGADLQCKNDIPLKQYESRVLISSGNLMWGKTHRLQMLENTLWLKCRLKMEDQRWRNDDSVGKILGRKNSATRCLASSFLLNDFFTYEILRTAEVCWPRTMAIKKPIPLHKNPFKYRDGYEGEFYEFTKFDRPICHLDIDGKDVTFKMDCSEFLECFSDDKTIVYKDAHGFHFCADQIISGFFFHKLKYYWHRQIFISKEIDNWTWQLNRFEGYFIAKIKLNN